MNKKIYNFLAITFILWGVCINSISAKTLNKSDINIFKLNNGQTLIVKEVHSNPIVTIDTWIKTGSINENGQNNGVSHFLEHLFFKGTQKHKAGEADKILETKGAVYNAATSKDFTHYYTTIPSKHFEEAVDLQADMLLNPLIPQEEMDKERKVVQEEIRRSKDNPGVILFNNLNGLMFKKHPYKYETLGTAEIIGNISREEVFNYYHRWYVPQNMVTVVVGDIETEKAKNLIENYFSQNNDKKFLGQIKHQREPVLSESKSIIKKGNYNTTYMYLGFKGVPVTEEKDNYALDVLSSILGDGKSSRLYQNLKEKNNIVASIDSGHFSMKDDSLFYISSVMKPENYKKAKQEIINQIKGIQTEPVTDEELNRAKKLYERQFLYNSESVEGIANSIGYCMTIADNLNCYTNYIEEIKKITKEDIKRVAIKYLNPSKMAESVLMPENVKISNIKPKENYKNTEKYILDNGITLIIDKNDSNKIAALNIFFKGGTLIEPVPGINSVIEQTLMRGTLNRTSIQIANELENLGIIINPSSQDDYFEISMKSTLQDFDKGLEVLADLIKNPVFDNNEIQKSKSDIIQALKAKQDNPSQVAFEDFQSVVFSNHPYGNDSKDIEKNLPTITREKVLSHYQKYFVPQNMVIAVSGNLDGEKLSSQLNSIFQKSSKAELINTNQLKKTSIPLKQNIFSPVYKDINTAWILLGWKAPSIINEKEYASLKIINSILGSGLSSRLFVNLREKQGLAYEISSVYPTRLDTSYFSMYMGTNPQNIKKAINGFLIESNKIKTESISEKELNETKQRITGQYALAQETNQQKAHYLGWFETIGKGYLFNYNYPDIINSVTVDDVKNAANKYFSEPYAISVVAPKASLESVEKEYKSESKR